MSEALADSMMVLHALCSMFLVGGLMLLSLGSLLGWTWTRNGWFRWCHLAVTLFIVLRAWAGWPCPFSVMEDFFRTAASRCVLSPAFHETLHRMAFRSQSPGDFRAAVSVFGVLVLLVWLADARLSRGREKV